MKKLSLYLIFSSLAFFASGQYYLRGEVIDEKNKPLPFAKIFVHSLRAFYTSGATSGDFGINVKQLNDSLTVSLDGYERTTVRVKTDQWQKIVLKSTEIGRAHV